MKKLLVLSLSAVLLLAACASKEPTSADKDMDSTQTMENENGMESSETMETMSTEEEAAM